MRPWLAIGYAAGIMLVSWVIRAWFGATPALGILCIAILIPFVYHLYNLSRLYRWVKKPEMHCVPESFGIWQDIYDELYQLVRAQAKQKKRLSATVDRIISAGEALPSGIIILDKNDCIEWCNIRAMDHWGLDRNRDTGQHITYMIRVSALRDYLARHDFSQPLIHHTGWPRNLVLSVQLFPFDVSHKLLLSRDITQLERVQTVHRDFVANVSHELKTPLTVINGFVETMLDISDIDEATRTRQLRMMQEQTQRMQHIVNDLLTLSRLESGQDLQEETIDIHRLIQVLLGEAEGLSKGGHILQYEVLTDCRLRGSYEELHSAFGNLVSNAIRYSPQGGVIKLSWHMQDAHDAAFSVQDSGIGIEAEHIPRLTERFYRIDRARSRVTGGTGLGLAIVKHILQRHQAQLLITSKVGAGSCFSARFPAIRLIHSAQ